MALVLFPLPLFAQITLTLTPPDLKPGWASVEALIVQNAESMLGDLETQANELLSKPQFMTAFIQGNFNSALTAARIPLDDGGIATLLVGATAGIQATPFSFDTFDLLSDADQSTDLPIGAAFQGINVQSRFNLGFILRGLEIGGSISWFQADSNDFDLQLFQAGGKLAWRFLRPEKISRDFTWAGLRIEAGASYGTNDFGTTAKLGKIDTVVEYDIDGSGPLVGFELTLEMDPSIALALHTTSLQGIFQLTTGIQILDAIALELGGGMAIQNGHGWLDVSADEEITILGYLSNQVEINPRISISGTASDTYYERYVPFACASLSFLLGPANLQIPVYYSFDDGLSLSVLMGVSF